MARYGKKSIHIEAPILKIQNKYVWMEEEWIKDFMGWLNQNNFRITGLQHMNKKLKLTFKTAKDCTIFGLKYAGKDKQKKVF
jgi:hypothetical protein